MIAVRLPQKLEDRLNTLSEKTGRTKTYYVREAIQRYLDDLEDTFIAVHRLERPARRMSMKEAKKHFGLDD